MLRARRAYKSDKKPQDYLRDGIGVYAAEACLWVPSVLDINLPMGTKHGKYHLYLRITVYTGFAVNTRHVL